LVIEYREGAAFALGELLALYRALGWRQNLYPERVARALAASTRVVTAWEGERLVGMARMVSDGEFCLYLPEILLMPTFQRRGCGTELMKRLLAGYEHVQHNVLLCDDGNEAFYRRFGFGAVTGAEGFKAMQRFGGWS
jgi:GNAT superfamily N-acetyltransferase